MTMRAHTPRPRKVAGAEPRRVYDVSELASRADIDVDELARAVARKAAPALVAALLEAGYIGEVVVRPAPLVTYDGLGEALGGGTDAIFRGWIKAGCPHVRVGDSPRFDVAEVRAWLRERAAKGGE